MTPEEKLCSRSWRMRNSAGILWSILSFGLLTGVGFLIRGAKSKDKLFIGLGVGFLIVGIGLFVSVGMFDAGTKEAPIRSTASTIWGWVWFTSFIGGIVTAVITNKKWLLWRAHTPDTKWYAQAGATQQQTPVPPAQGYDPNAAAAAFAAPSPAATYTNPAPTQTGSIDVNAASAQELVGSLGVDADTANRIIATRQQLGSFSSFEQLVAKAQVPPHLLIPQRGKLTFSTAQNVPATPPVQPTQQASQASRRLDL
ncbi:hypothetical protein ARZXY2_4708 (plasmid) [Arthrobacter sp. ZXY-2]|nr:hypothetical protein ARZXY2_4708 [Arthrobacter sp. ZXY-2]